jgi:hypothetical protein
MALLWLMIAVIMCMHETYDVTGIIFGINVRSATANGTVPAIEHALRLAFDTGSMLIAVLVLYNIKSKWFKWFLQVWLGLMIPANILHLVATYKEDPASYSQFGILLLVLLISILLFVDNYKWIKKRPVLEKAEG